MGGRGRWAATWAATGAASAAVVLAGCATTPASAPVKTPAAAPKPPAPVAPRFVATPGLTPAERLRNLLDLLNSGARDQARAEAQELVRQEPDNARAKSLLNQIDADPAALLGSTNFSYKLKAGETLQTVAERYLGDRTLFYALARYNGLAAPNLAQPGMTILVPGVRRPAAPAAAPRRRTPSGSETPRAAPAPGPAAPARNPAQARALRSQALLQMNRGAINRAVDLLRQAAQLNPDSAPIKADLARAVRIQRATHGG